MPLKPGNSKETVSQNISEFHTGKTYAHTLKKFGKKKADAQAVAVAMSTARKYARKAEGGDNFEPEPNQPTAPRSERLYVSPNPPQGDGGWSPPIDLMQSPEATGAIQKVMTGMAGQMQDWAQTPGRIFQQQPPQVERATPGYETEEEAFLQDLANQKAVEEQTDWGAGTAMGNLGVARVPGMGPPEGAITAGAGKPKFLQKYFHPYDMDPGLLKKADQVGGQKGSNPGGLYTLPNGEPVYVKTPPTVEHTYNEKLAAELYKLAGVPVADVKMTKFNGQPSIVSPIIPGKTLANYSAGEMIGMKDLAEHYPVDLWLGNYDWVGTGKDNVIVDPTGRAWRIDTGGALRFRAQGALKNEDMWGPDVKHFDLKKSYDMGAVMAAQKNVDQIPAAKRVASLTDNQIKGMVDKFGPLKKGEKEKLTQTLIARRDGVAKLYGLDKEPPPSPPSGSENVLPMAPALAKGLANVHGNDPYKIANHLFDIQKVHGKAYADEVGKNLPSSVRHAVGEHLDTLEALDELSQMDAVKHDNPHEFAMDDDFEPPPDLGPEGWGVSEQAPWNPIKHTKGNWWDDAPAVKPPSGVTHPTIAQYKNEFERAEQGLPSAFKKINNWSEYELPYQHEMAKPELKNVTPEQLKELGGNPNFQVIKGVKPHQTDYPHELDNPANKQGSDYSYERAIYFFPHDTAHDPGIYGSVSKPYVILARNAYEAYYPRLRGKVLNDPVSYSSTAFQRIIDAGHEHGADVIILHGVNDMGPSNQTQILILDTRGTLRATNAKFNPEHLVPYSLHSRKPLYGVIGGIPFAFDALKKMDDGKEDKKMARGGKVKFHPYSSIEIKDRKLPKTVIAPHKTKHITKKYARGGKTEDEPKPHEFINFKRGGMIDSDIPGRTDKIPMKVATGAYVLPADIPSALGQGNSKAGKIILDKMFSSGPYGLATQKGKASKFSMPHLKGFAHGGKVAAEKALPADHQLGMKVPKGGSMCANCAFFKSPDHCGNEGFIKWNGSGKLPEPADEYCCDLYQSKKAEAKADGGATNSEDDHVPIIAAGGEYIIHPEVVKALGAGDMDKGHKVLDKFVLHTRNEHIKTLQKLKPPK